MRKRQWIGIIAFVIIVAIIELTVALSDRYVSSRRRTVVIDILPEREAAYGHYLDSVRSVERQARYAELRASRNKPNEANKELRSFDPNKDDSVTLVDRGVQPFVARMIVRYRERGKIYRTKKDIGNVYGVTDSLFTLYSPFIAIDSIYVDSLLAVRRQNMKSKSTNSFAGDSAFAYINKLDTIVEINSADTAVLVLLRGVGSFSAEKIVKYRTQLGGFYSVEQLREIDGLHEENLDSLLSHIYVDTTLIQPILVNKASVKRLQHHPYISYQQAVKIYELRRRKIRLHSLDELTVILTDEEQLRLRPYLSFD